MDISIIVIFIRVSLLKAVFRNIHSYFHLCTLDIGTSSITIASSKIPNFHF